MATKTIFLSSLLVYLIVIDGICCDRGGFASETLHLSPLMKRSASGSRYQSITAPSSETLTKGALHDRVRRQLSPTADNGITTLQRLNDSNIQMIIHWAGEGSKVMVALTKNPPPLRVTSNAYFSYDYGKTFQEVQHEHMKIGSGQALLDKFYNSHVINSHYIFTDLIHKKLFITTDYGKSFSMISVDFVPRLLLMNEADWQLVLAYDEEDVDKRLYVSENFGRTWRVVQDRVKSFQWGQEPLDGPRTIFVERRGTGNTSTILVSNDLFQHSRDVMSGVMDFQMGEKDYLFATKDVSTRDSKKLELWVSYKRRAFRRALFPSKSRHEDYYIADCSEEQVMVVVRVNETNVLYVSDQNGERYTHSLDNITYINPKEDWSGRWFSRIVDESFADIHKVEGLDGIYIANRYQDGGNISSGQQTVITYNKGGHWEFIKAPRLDSLGNHTHCDPYRTPYDHSLWNESDGMTAYCSLHLTQKFHALDPSMRTTPLLSKKSAIGLIMGMGSLNNSISSDPNVFLSQDGGLEWREVLKGPHMFAFGDHGGLIVAVKQMEDTGELMYSYNEGETWNTYEFSDKKMHVYGIMTEPEERTTVFSIFGSDTVRHSWVIIQVNLSSVFSSACGKDDYKDWSPADSPRVDCLLGRRTVYERRITHSLCYNGRDYERSTTVHNCSCRREDYECDYGFTQRQDGYFFWSNTCVRDNSSDVDIHAIPSPCPEGTFYKRTKGYRRVVGDTCSGGVEHLLEPDNMACPVKGAEEFIIYSLRNSVYRYIFGTQQTELVASGLQSTVSVEYDYNNNCAYWADVTLDIIQRLCFNDSNPSVHTIIRENIESIEGLALDWMASNLYYVDAGTTQQKIEVARTDGTHRRTLVSDGLDKPRAIALYLQQGLMFWSDWSEENPSIKQAWLDGSHITILVHGTARLGWPNGLAVDEQHHRLYWTDAKKDSINYIDIVTKEIKVLVQNTFLTPHPYSIALYKDDMYWTDWHRDAILVADKNTGNGGEIFLPHLRNITDLKILHVSSQNAADKGPCDKHSGQCTSLCVNVPHNQTVPVPLTRKCLCSDEYASHSVDPTTGDENCLCEDGEHIDDQGFCVEVNGTCAADQFACSNGRCVPAIWRCDADNDCGDRSDEMNCPYHTCRSDQFSCNNGRCIPEHWQCDHDDDCGDGSDEPRGCTYDTCEADKFTCYNGRCIPKNWLCDGDDDCHDMSDEKENCSPATMAPHNATSCNEQQFTCDSGLCITASWKCDGADDCGDNSDEIGCEGRNETCDASFQFRCKNQHCVYNSWMCDGDDDCGDGSDEDTTMCAGRTTTTRRPTTTAGYPACDNWSDHQCPGSGICISSVERCDGIDDCGDNSDEEGCEGSATGPCLLGWYKCPEGSCIRHSQLCDGLPDCREGNDEQFCTTTGTPTDHPPTPGGFCEDKFMCDDGRCIFQNWVCDGEEDCEAGEDEAKCNGTKTCSGREFKCLFSDMCIPVSWLCDGDEDCTDGSDEAMACTRNSTTTSAPASCHHWEFDCGDGECIYVGKLCDGRMDCRSGRDEEICGRNTTRNHYEAVFNIEDFLPDERVTIHWGTIHPEVTKWDVCSVYVLWRPQMIDTMVDWASVKEDCKAHNAIITVPDFAARFDYAVLIQVNGTNSTMPRSKTATRTNLGAPRNVSYTIPINGDDSLVKVSWQPPLYNARAVTEYTVHYNSSDGFPAHLMVSADGSNSHQSATLSNLLKGKTYDIWVTASDGQGEGPPSNHISMDWMGSGGCRVSVSSKARDHDMRLTIQATSAQVVGFDVRLWSRDPPLDMMESVRAAQKDGKAMATYQSNDILASGSLYTVEVVAKNSTNGEVKCGSEIKLISTDGSSLSPPRIAKVTQHSPSVLAVNISDPNKATTKQYRVYYSASRLDSELPADWDSVQHVDSTSSLVYLPALNLCENYFLVAQVIKPFPSKLSQVETAMTGDDEFVQPQNVELTVNHSTSEWDLVVRWKGSCPVQKYEQITFEVKATTSSGISNSFQSTSPKHTNLERVIHNVTRGETYSIQVRSINAGVQSHFTAPRNITIDPYPAPRHFFLLHNVKPNVHRLTWDEPPKDAETPTELRYEVLHAQKGEHENTYPPFTSYGETAEKFMDVVNLSAEHIHAFRVRVANHKGFPGAASNIQEVLMEPLDKLQPVPNPPHDNPAASTDSGGGISQSVLLGISVPGGLLVLALLVSLAVYVVRHRRLRRSFASFASSHYDTRSQRTTFGDGGSGGEMGGDEDDMALDGGEEDQPLIRGFADDEPLVVA